MHIAISKRVYYISFVLFIIYIITSWVYRITFIGQIEYNNSAFRKVYSGLLLTDTIEYYRYLKLAGHNWFLATLNSGVKNYLGPMILIYFMGNFAYGDLIINNIFILISLYFLIRTLILLNIRNIWSIILLIGNPMTIFYSQGFNKEIPLILCLIVFMYSIASRNKILSFFTIIITYIFRTQIGILLALFIIVQKIYKSNKKNFLYGWVWSIPFMFIFPFFYRIIASPFVENANSYYSNSGGSGIGKIASVAMMKFPFAGYVGLPIHVVQNILEPLLYINIKTPSGVSSFLSSLITIPFFIIFIIQVVNLLFTGRIRENKYYNFDMHILVFLGLLMIATIPFIHSRYLFIFSPILPLSIKKLRKFRNIF